MHDFAALEGQGVIAAFIASTEFISAADVQAGALGYAQVPAIFVPHPIQDRTDDEMRALAEGALEEVLAAVTGTGLERRPERRPERRGDDPDTSPPPTGPRVHNH